MDRSPVLADAVAAALRVRLTMAFLSFAKTSAPHGEFCCGNVVTTLQASEEDRKRRQPAFSAARLSGPFGNSEAARLPKPSR